MHHHYKTTYSPDDPTERMSAVATPHMLRKSGSSKSFYRSSPLSRPPAPIYEDTEESTHPIDYRGVIVSWIVVVLVLYSLVCTYTIPPPPPPPPPTLTLFGLFGFSKLSSILKLIA